MRTVFLLIFSLITLFSIGQELSVYAEKKSFLIGEQFTLFYKIQNEQIDSVGFERQDKFIKAFLLNGKDTLDIELEIIQDFQDTVISYNNNKQWIGKYKITCWDSGNVVIPKKNAVLNGTLVYFKPFSFEVLLSDKVAGKELYDIKESFFDLPIFQKDILSFLKKYWWIILIILIVVSVLVWYFIRKKRLNDIKDQMSLEQEMISKIDELNGKKLWLNHLLKDHYVELSFILRTYLSRKTNLNLLEKTSDEALVLLAAYGFNESSLNEIQSILEQSDMVKFAKSIPEEYVILKNSNLTKEIIEKVSAIK